MAASTLDGIYAGDNNSHVQTQALFHLAYDSDLLEYRFLLPYIIGSTSYLHTPAFGGSFDDIATTQTWYFDRKHHYHFHIPNAPLSELQIPPKASRRPWRSIQQPSPSKLPIPSLRRLRFAHRPRHTPRRPSMHTFLSRRLEASPDHPARVPTKSTDRQFQNAHLPSEC